MSCCNDGCPNDARGPNRILMTIDGDFACSQRCKEDYERKRDHFFNNIVHSEELTEQWLLGKID